MATKNIIDMAFNAFIDDDSMATASATNVCSGESIKAYVDTQIGALPALAFNSVNTQTISATGAFTYTPTVGTKYAIFEIQGAGGGSGGSTGAGGQTAASGPGGGGAYRKILVTGSANLAAITGSVGAGGTAGAAGNNSGGTGGSTTLDINSGTTWTAGGGVGGGGQTSSASSKAGGTIGTGGANSAGTNGTSVWGNSGGTGGYGFSNGADVTVYMAGKGGASFLASPALNGGAVRNFGGGAAGVLNGSGGDLAGQAGAAGIVIVTEFISA